MNGKPPRQHILPPTQHILPPAQHTYLESVLCMVYKPPTQHVLPPVSTTYVESVLCMVNLQDNMFYLRYIYIYMHVYTGWVNKK